MRYFDGVFANKTVLLTGHTGFKGSWLTFWLQQLGADVHGIALPPDSNPSHWQLLNLKTAQALLDINQAERLKYQMQQIMPDVVIHMAAQPLVRLSYDEPVSTWHTNVMGTVNVLEACRTSPSVKAIVVVTTDKVYENTESGQAFSETMPLGGYDPYSASKAACELLVQSYRHSFMATNDVLVATARAGNVIGGGDWAANRLIPDIVRASQAGEPLLIRYPNAVRPWQHVMDSLSGYLCLTSALLRGETEKAKAWNFGPDSNERFSVSQVLTVMQRYWSGLRWQEESHVQLEEAGLLILDSSLAKRELAWKPVWPFAEAAKYTAQWYNSFYQKGDLLTASHIEQYCLDAQRQGVLWAQS